MLQASAFLLMIFGVAIAVFGGGVPIGGFKNNKRLLIEYKKARQKGERASLDQQGAYYTVLCYKIGIALFCASLVIFGLHFIFHI